MTTESTSVPPPPGRARTAEHALGQQALGTQSLETQPLRTRPLGWAAITRPRDRPDRVAPPPRRRTTGATLRFGLPLAVVDGLAAVLSTVVLNDEQRDALLIVQLVSWVTVLNACTGLYRPGAVLPGLDQLPALAARIAAAWCATAAVCAALLPVPALGLPALLGGAAVQLVASCAGRSLLYARRRATARDRRRSALIVGTGTAARRLTSLLAQHPEYGLRAVGTVAPAPGAQDTDGPGHGTADGTTKAPALPLLTTIEEVHRAVIQNGVQEALFIDSDSGPDAGPGADEQGLGDHGEWTGRAALVALFHEYGCATSFVGPGPWEAFATPTVMGHHVWGFSSRRVQPPAPRRAALSAKRLLDVLIALPVLLAASPVLLACALAVRCCDGRDVLFRQERIGQNGRPFTLLKFRTLRPADEQESATRWNIANDLRMSPVGNILRRTSLDELPQLWNVLRGDMSLVGPRPERPYFVANFSKTHPGYAARHRMPVGITGLAQVHGLRGDTSIEERSRFDNHYIDHWSLWQDVCILLRTAAALLRPAGS